MNRFIATGNLGNDPEISYTKQSGLTIAKFNLAVRRRYAKEGEIDTDWFKCTAFGKIAEFVEKYLRKGSKVFIEGEVRNDDYEKDGVKYYSNDIIIKDIEFGDSKKNSDTTKKEAPKDDKSGDEFMNIPEGTDDELPFN